MNNTGVVTSTAAEESPFFNSPSREILEKEAQQMMGFDQFPYLSRLSLQPLIEFWREKKGSEDKLTAMMAQAILSEVDQHPVLEEPFDDVNELRQHQSFLELLVSGLFPAPLRHQIMAKVSKPFDILGIYATPPLRKIVEAGQFRVCMDKNTDWVRKRLVLQAASCILNEFYGQSINVDEPSVFTIRTEDQLERHMKASLNTDFVRIRPIQPLRPLSQQQINQLLSNIYDVNLWLEYLPPDRFEFYGLSIVNLFDITEEESLSRLKHVLLEKDAVVVRENIDRLEQILKNFFWESDLKLGITAIDYPRENMVSHEYKIRHDFLADQFNDLLQPAFNGSVYERACKFGETVIVEDLMEFNAPTPIEGALLEKGFRSVLISPLKDKEGKVLGLLELGAPKAFVLNNLMALKLKEILPMFRTAIQRSREEIDNQLEVIIREQYTALHPSVDWRFVKAAYRLMQLREEKGKTAKGEPIVFEKVYPLYGQADIVSSSSIRNESIQADLIANLRAAQKLLSAADEVLDYPVLKQYQFKIEKEISQLQKGIATNDEHRIIGFITKEIHGLLELIRQRSDQLDLRIGEYESMLDPELGVVYDQRKRYEESIGKINDEVSCYLEEEQRALQEMLPHYFEKYKTDGVEYDLYVGQSLLRQGRFDDMHLRNIRLWQLIAMCEITRKVERMKSGLPMPLTTAQLVLVHSNPLAIRFRMDEKQFDVDGAYNARYEIIKKRVDKAVINGTGERLTAPGKIAIVYADERDRDEYWEYLDYLSHHGYIDPDIEDLDVDDLQGVHGLKAFRLSVLTAEGQAIESPRRHASKTKTSMVKR